MYFDDIFNRIKPLWKDRYEIGDLVINETFARSLADDWENNHDRMQLARGTKDFNEWDSMMLFVIYQVLTEYAIDQFKKNELEIVIGEIPFELFERKFLKNLQFDGNEVYLRNYKGARKNSN